MITTPALRWLSLEKLAHLPGREFTLSIIGWSLFLTYRTIHCQFYNVYIDTSDRSSLAWVLQEYGIWVLLTPLLWRVMSWNKRQEKPSKLTVALSVTAALLISVCYRVGLDLWTTAGASFGASLVYFVPTHIAVLAFLLICWLIIYGQPVTAKPSKEINLDKKHTTHNPTNSALTTPPTTQQTLTVQKGNTNISLTTTDIDYICAAGNYVDIFSQGKTYLLRATMKQLADQLPETDFVRIHRSYIININTLESLTTDSVQLRTEQTLPVGAKYHRNLKSIYNQKLTD